MPPIVLSVDGNIGAGKTTFLMALAKACPDYDIVLEPVADWMTLSGPDGKSLLELFYEDKRRWAYTFQTCALLTRIKSLKAALASTKNSVIITERSVLTDRHMFAEMLRSSGDIGGIEWAVYNTLFDECAAPLPLSGIIYLTTDAPVSKERIMQRARKGEERIMLEYLQALDEQHARWISSTSLPVLRLNTDDFGANFSEVRSWVSKFSS